MFTGVIRHVGTVSRVSNVAAGRRLTVDLGPLAQGLKAGDSVAVNGACLTAAKIEPPLAGFNVVKETLSRTTLGSLAAGAKVNLERSLRASDALDGHLVQGHVDGVATVRAMRRGEQHAIEFKCDPELTVQMIAKGSVAVDGVSLTLTDVAADGFSVALIPTTLKDTTLGDLRIGSKVNVEADVIGKYVQKYLRSLVPSDNAVTLKKLKDAGF